MFKSRNQRRSAALKLPPSSDDEPSNPSSEGNSPALVPSKSANRQSALSSPVESLKTILRTQSSQIPSSRVSSSAAELAEMETELRSLREIVRSKTEEAKKHALEKESLELDVKSLNEKISEVSENEVKVEGLESAVESLKRQLADAIAEKDVALLKAEESVSAVQSLHSDFSRLSQERKLTEENAESVSSELDTIKLEVSLREKSLKEEAVEMESLRNQISDLKSQKLAAEEDAKSSSLALAAVEKEMSDILREKAALEEKLNSSTAPLSVISLKQKEILELTDRVSILENANSSLFEKCKQWEASDSQMKAVIQHLTSREHELSALVKSAEADIAFMTTSIEQLQSQCTKLTEDLIKKQEVEKTLNEALAKEKERRAKSEQLTEFLTLKISSLFEITGLEFAEEKLSPGSREALVGQLIVRTEELAGKEKELLSLEDLDSKGEKNGFMKLVFPWLNCDKL